MGKILKNCELCMTELRYYDSVLRSVRTKGGQRYQVKVPRYKCLQCGKIQRHIPDFLYPYKQYEREIINGVVEGLISCEVFGFEDYPCEMTMLRWIKEFFHRSCFYQK